MINELQRVKDPFYVVPDDSVVIIFVCFFRNFFSWTETKTSLSGSS